MYLAEEATRNFHGFDVFMILFTIIIAWGFIRSVRAREKNKLAIGFSLLCLIVFLVTDVLMVLNWFGKLA